MSVTILDGGISRELIRLNAPFRQPEWSALSLIEAPNLVQQAHQEFIQAGAEIITTNSYAVVPFHIGEQRFNADGRMLSERAGRLAKNAVNQTAGSAKVAGSLPPLFGSYRPDLFNTDRVQELAEPLIQGLSPYADLWLLETQSSIIEPCSVIPLLPHDRPIWVSFTLDDHKVTQPCLRSGETVEQAITQMLTLNIDAILFNCCQPEVIENALKITASLIQASGKNVRFGAYANAFKPQEETGAANEQIDELREDLHPEGYLQWTKKWVAMGATLIGGCCGIGVEHIRTLAQTFKHN